MKIDLNIADIVSRIESISMNGSAFYEHVKNGTLEKYYQELLTTMVNDMTLLTIERSYQDFDPVETMTIVNQAYTDMVAMIATLFQKNKQNVTHDLFAIMRLYPVEDIHLSQFYKHQNMLN